MIYTVTMTYRYNVILDINISVVIVSRIAGRQVCVPFSRAITTR